MSRSCRRDQVLMYELLGDPATRLRLPEKLQASVEKIDGKWHWRAVKPPRAAQLEVGFRNVEPLGAIPAAKQTECADGRQDCGRSKRQVRLYGTVITAR